MTFLTRPAEHGALSARTAAIRLAVPKVRRAAHWISALPGEYGAVREACELMIAAIEDA